MQITHQRILNIAIPIVLANVTVPLLSLVDTGVVGQIDSPIPIAAVGMGGLILNTTYWFFGFLRMGTTGLASQALGAQNSTEVNAILTRVLLLGGAAGLLIIALQIPLFWLAFQLSPATEAVETQARLYMQIRVLSAPAAIAIYGLNGWLIAQERTRSVLLLQIWMNGLNILLDLWFVIGQGWGVQGVAWASFLSEISALVLGLLICRNILLGRDWRNWSRVFDRNMLLRMVNVNRDILLRTLILQCISVSFFFVAADFGVVELAATHVLGQFLIVTVFALDGFAFAAETLVGQAIGARSRSGFRRSALMASYWAVGIALLLTLAIALFGNWMIELLSKSEEVRQTAVKYLPFLLLMPIVGVGSWMLDGIFIGATQTRDMRNMMAISLLVYGIALIFLVPIFGLFGLWTALLISLIARGVTLGFCYPGLEKRVLAKR